MTPINARKRPGRPPSKKKKTFPRVPSEGLKGVVTFLRNSSQLTWEDIGRQLKIRASTAKGLIDGCDRKDDLPDIPSGAMVCFRQGDEIKVSTPTDYVAQCGQHLSMTVPQAVVEELKYLFVHIYQEFTFFADFREVDRWSEWAGRVQGKKATRPGDVELQDLKVTVLSCYQGLAFSHQCVIWARFEFSLVVGSLKKAFQIESMHFVPLSDVLGTTQPSNVGYEFQTILDRTTDQSTLKPQCYSLPLLKFFAGTVAGRPVDSQWSGNGKIVILGMGGNVIGMQFANSLSRVLESIPNSTIHVSDIEPTVITTCIEQHLLGFGNRTFVYPGDNSLENLPSLLNAVETNSLAVTSVENVPLRLILVDCFDPLLGKTNMGGGNFLDTCLQRCADQNGIVVLNTHFPPAGNDASPIKSLANHIGSIMELCSSSTIERYQWAALQIDRLSQAIVIIQLKFGPAKTAAHFKNLNVSTIPAEISNIIGHSGWSLIDHCSKKIDVPIVVNNIKQIISIYSHFSTLEE